mmetsp:Transcript_5655/g.13286  ORF Transcript_5655/g.13286 Transcript_5655/m.13286 type:complete len:141 (+) Transcript_5655:123-545(+)
MSAAAAASSASSAAAAASAPAASSTPQKEAEAQEQPRKGIYRDGLKHIPNDISPEEARRRWLGTPNGCFVVGITPTDGEDGWDVLQVDTRNPGADGVLKTFLEEQLKRTPTQLPDPEVFAAAVRAQLGLPPLVQRSEANF